jgi:hypothetical protein
MDYITECKVARTTSTSTVIIQKKFDAIRCRASHESWLDIVASAGGSFSLATELTALIRFLPQTVRSTGLNRLPSGVVVL